MLIKDYTLKATYSVLAFFILGIISSVLDSFFLVEAVMFLVMVYLIKCHDLRTLVGFTVMTLFQNIYLILFSETMTSTDTQMMIIMKEIIIYVVGASIYSYRLMHKRRWCFDDILLVLLLVYLLAAFIMPGAPVKAKITALRQICIPPLCIMFGYSLSMTKQKIDKYLTFYNSIMVMFCLIGLLIYVLPDDIWLDMNYETYYFKKNNMIYDGSFANFYSHDFGPRLKRFVSITADPVASSHILCLAVFFLLFSLKKKYLFLKIFLITCSVLCFSKTVLFYIVCTFVLLKYLNIKKKKWRIIALCFIITALVCSVTVINIYLASLESATAAGNHLNSLLYGLTRDSLTGDGLGTAGYNVITTGGNVDDNAEATESFFAILISQIGILGTILFYGFLFTKIYRMVTIYKRHGGTYMLSVTCMLVCVTFESLTSGSSVTMLGTGLYFIMVGVIEKQRLNQLKYKL